ncbi:chorismate mutase [Streptomyces sp. NPDC048191]|uniref:chorismate mutase n=1 Tax=Streptomyces sp. NPDC048191 TaxID=3155484 RepID=UPI0033F0956A
MSAIRSWVAVLALTGVAAAALAACDSSHASSRPARQGTATAETALGTIARLAGERVMTADTVAAAKWGTRQPIDDPAREKTVLDSAAAQGAQLGIPPATVRRIFTDQIAANKDVQRALYTRWHAQPAEQPTHRPDLATQVRPVLDRIDGRLLAAIVQARPLLDGPGCSALLRQQKETTARALGLDAVHKTGLDQALAHICESR